MTAAAPPPIILSEYENEYCRSIMTVLITCSTVCPQQHLLDDTVELLRLLRMQVVPRLLQHCHAHVRLIRPRLPDEVPGLLRLVPVDSVQP